MEIVLVIGAILVAWLVFTWLFKVIKVSLKTAFLIAAIVLILQYAFGISPQKLWEEILHLPQLISGWVKR
jgi:hypothetical protein